jgi:calcineurin-like phosphoesterase
MKILFIGDIFGEPGIQIVEKYLPELIKKKEIDFVIAQGENVSNRKGLIKTDYDRLKKVGVNAFTMGNHVFAKKDIYNFIDDVNDIVRPLNAYSKYGKGTQVFKVKGKTLRVTSLLGVSFMYLYTP